MLNIPGGVFYVLIVITTAIVVDTLLGAITAAVKGQGFDIRQLPRFLASGILPFVGGLGILALAAGVIGEPFAALFYAAAAAATAKYVAEVKDKLTCLLGISIGGDDLGDDNNREEG